MKKLFLELSFIGVIAFSCVKHDEKNPVILEGLIIRTGQRCGWCAGSDSLTLTMTEGYYEFHPACSGKSKYGHEQTDLVRWNDLLSKLDWDKFKSIDVNACGICVDGCDTWISIQKDDDIHKIQFVDTSPEKESIKSFAEALDAWRNDFMNK